MVSEDVQTFTPKQYSLKIVYEFHQGSFTHTAFISHFEKYFIMNHLKV